MSLVNKVREALEALVEIGSTTTDHLEEWLRIRTEAGDTFHATSLRHDAALTTRNIESVRERLEYLTSIGSVPEQVQMALTIQELFPSGEALLSDLVSSSLNPGI